MLKRFESGWPSADVRALVGRYSAGLREVDAVRYMMHVDEFKRRDPEGFALALQEREARRVILMPINPDGLECTYNPAGAASFADLVKNKARAAVVVFVVVLPEGVHVFKNKTDAEQLAARYGATVAESVVM